MIRVFSPVIPTRVFTLFISEVVLLFACYVLAAAYADPDTGDLVVFLQYDWGLARIGIVACFIFAGLFFGNLYTEARVRSRVVLLQNLCLIFGVAFIGQGLISYIDRDWIVPRRMMLAGSILAGLSLFGWRLLFDSASRNAVAAARVLFLGMSPTVVKLAGYFDTHPEFGLAAVGYLETGNATSIPTGVARLGTMADFDGVLDEYTPDRVIIGNREDVRPWWTDDFLALRFGGVGVEEAGTLYERVFARKCVTEIWPSQLIFSGAADPSSANVMLQSLYSRVVAFVVLLPAAPLMLAAAALVRISSPGPVLERAQRIGLHDEPFDIYRFRTRRADGSATAAGRFLERWRLRNLPRLFNVLRGEMAIVGPRPECPLHARRLSEAIPFYRQRHRVKPGLTGWARVHSGENEHDTLRELEYDLYYAENLSPLLDSVILVLSLKMPWLR